MQISIRQSGGANIVSLPKAVLKMLGLHPGSSLVVSVEDHRIILTPVDEDKKLTLEALLANSPKEHFQLTDEDKEWLDAELGGEEW